MSDTRQINSTDEMYCSHCGAIIKKAAEICPKCGCRVAPAPSSARSPAVTPNQDDKSSFGFAFLGFCFPIVGLILFLVWNSTYPLKAKSSGTGALIGFILGIISWIIWGVIAAVIAEL